eukprot:3809466-Pleurochrysis_carterae.AAC.2
MHEYARRLSMWHHADPNALTGCPTHRSIAKSAGNEASVYDLVERLPDCWSAPAFVGVAPGASMGMACA